MDADLTTPPSSLGNERAALRALLHIVSGSAAIYLQDARPWVSADHEAFCQALADLAADHRHYAQQITERLLALGERPGQAAFPLAFSSINDLAADYLVRRVVAFHREDIARLRRAVALLEAWPAHRAVAEEVLGNALGHFEVLEKLAAT